MFVSDEVHPTLDSCHPLFSPRPWDDARERAEPGWRRRSGRNRVEKKKTSARVKWAEEPLGFFTPSSAVLKQLWKKRLCGQTWAPPPHRWLLLHACSSIGLMWSHGNKVCYLRDLSEGDGAAFYSYCQSTDAPDKHRLRLVNARMQNTCSLLHKGAGKADDQRPGWRTSFYKFITYFCSKLSFPFSN